MSINDCLYTLEDHPELLERFKRDLAESDIENVPKYIQQLIEDTKSERRMVQLSAVKTQAALKYIEGYVGGDPHRRSYESAINNLLAADYELGRTASGYTSMEMRAESINALFQSEIAEFMHHYRPRKVGLDRSVKAQDELVRAIYGDTTDVDIKAYVKNISEVLEHARTWFNRTGGNIQKLDSYRLPQPSDPIRVGRVSRAKWKEFVIDKLDRTEKVRQAKSVLGLADDAVVSDKQINKALDKIYDGIRTRGAASLVPGKSYGAKRRKVSARHQEHRFLHFKDADSWLAYNKKFGQGTPFSAITNHLDRMSRDIAAMETLGPHPEKTLEFLIDHVRKSMNKINAGTDARTIYKTVMGEYDGVPNPKIASLMRDARNVMAATKLPMATLSAISDSYFLGRTAMLNDIPTVKIYKRMLKNLSTGSAEDRLFAGKLGLTMEYALDKVAAFSRISTVTGNNWTSKAVDFALRANGLNYWTTTLEHVFGLEFAQMLAEKSRLPFKDLGKLQQVFNRYGITEQDWNGIRKAKMEKYKSMTYLNATSLTDTDLMAKVQGMILAETRMAVPRPTAKVRAKMFGSSAPGTAAHELRQSIFQFKGFPVSVFLNQWARELSHDSKITRLMAFGSLIAGTTILGSLAYNAKEIAKGKTPLDWESGAFWANGFVQGGGLSLIGDALFLDPTKQGGVTQFLAGPLVGETDKFIKNFVLTPIRDLAEQEDRMVEKLATNATKFAESYTPSPLNLPVIKTMMQRAIFDQIHKRVNSNWHSNRRRIARELKKTRKQEYWWKPGKMKPEF